MGSVRTGKASSSGADLTLPPALEPNIDRDVDQDLAPALRLAVGRLARRIRQEHHGTLTPSQHSALVSVEDLAPVRLSDLAAAEGISSPTLTKIVAGLEDAGLVQRSTDEADRRSSLLQLTEAGRATLHAIRTERTAFLRRQLDRLSDDDRRCLSEALPVLTALAEADDTA